MYVNAAADDEFLAGTSVSGDSAYWVGYLAACGKERVFLDETCGECARVELIK
jgi:hypothetical protein